MSQDLCTLLNDTIAKKLGDDLVISIAKYPDSIDINVIEVKTSKSRGGMSFFLGSGEIYGLEIGKNEAYLYDIEVKKDFRGKEYGSILLCYLTCYLLENKYTKLYFHVADTSGEDRKLFRWYESFGFKESEKEDDLMYADLKNIKPECIERLKIDLECDDDLSVKNFIKVLLKDKNTSIIGEGGYGVVFGNSNTPEIAVKQSKKGEEKVCKEWEEEFKIQSVIYEKYNENFSKEITELVQVVPPCSFITIDHHCYILMSRICSPTEKYSDCAVHLLMNKTDYAKRIGKRGCFLGRDYLKVIELENKMKELSQMLGTFIGYLHYGLKFDGLDLEYIIGHICDSKHNQIYVIDFGMVRKIEKYNEETIDRMINSIIDVEYFPLEGDLFNHFKSSYISIAKTYEKEEIAEKVMDSI